MKCFIVSSIDTDLSDINNLLENNNINYFSSFKDIKAGQAWEKTIKRHIKTSDFIVAIYNSKSLNVIFELGICIGLGKKIFLIVPKKQQLPFDLSGFLYIHANPDDYDKIQFALSNFINRLRPIDEKEAVKKIIGSDKENLQAKVELSRIYQKQNKMNQAEKILIECLKDDPTNSFINYELSKVYQKEGRPESAMNILYNYLNFDKDNLQIRLEISKICQKQKKWDKAEKILNEMLNIDKSNLHARTELSKIYQHQKKYFEAEKVLLETISIDNQNLQARLELGKIYRHQRRYRDAEKVFLETLALYPQYIPSRIELSRILQLTQRFDQAEKHLLESLHIDPQNQISRFELSKIYEKQNRYDEAERVLLELLEINGHDARAKKELNNIYEKEHRIEKFDHKCIDSIIAPIKSKELENIKLKIAKYTTTKNAMQFEKSIRSLLKYLNAEIVVGEIKKGREIDFSVWIDEFDNTIGNPIIIETKCGSINNKIINQCIMQLTEYINNSNAKIGILLYKNISKNVLEKSKFYIAPVFILDIDYLIEELKYKSFSQILINLKNS